MKLTINRSQRSHLAWLIKKTRLIKRGCSLALVFGKIAADRKSTAKTKPRTNSRARRAWLARRMSRERSVTISHTRIQRFVPAKCCYHFSKSSRICREEVADNGEARKERAPQGLAREQGRPGADQAREKARGDERSIQSGTGAGAGADTCVTWTKEEARDSPGARAGTRLRPRRPRSFSKLRKNFWNLGKKSNDSRPQRYTKYLAIAVQSRDHGT